MKDDEVELCKYSTHTWTSQKLNKITNTFLKSQKKKNSQSQPNNIY